jgi:lysozyme
MTTPFLAADIGHDEGLRLHAYPDPDTGDAPWTIGYGCTGADIRPGLVWTKAEADAALTRRIDQVQGQLESLLPWWREVNDPRQDVLVNMAYNLGVRGLLGFHSFLAAAQAGRNAAAADDLLISEGRPTRWARQVHGRAARLARQWRDGVRIAP